MDGALEALIFGAGIKFTAGFTVQLIRLLTEHLAVEMLPETGS